MFELKQQSRNYRHVGNFPTCRQMSCRLDTLADTTFSCVCDMTKDMSPTCRRDTRHVFKRRLGKTFQKKTFPAKALDLSRECLILSCLPTPSFADVSCRVGDMSETCLWSCRRHKKMSCRPGGRNVTTVYNIIDWT